MKLSDLLQKLSHDPSLCTGQSYVEGGEDIAQFLDKLQYKVHGQLKVGFSGKRIKAGNNSGCNEANSLNSILDLDVKEDDKLPIPFLLEISSSKVHEVDKLQDGAWVRSCFGQQDSKATSKAAKPKGKGHKSTCLALLARINGLKTMDFCGQVPHVQVIDISHNYLASVQGAAACSGSLRYLDCSGNSLREVSFGPPSMQCLTVLRLSAFVHAVVHAVVQSQWLCRGCLLSFESGRSAAIDIRVSVCCRSQQNWIGSGIVNLYELAGVGPVVQSHLG